MLDPIEIAIFSALGAIFAAGLAVLARWGGRSFPDLAGYALIAACFVYVGLSFGSENPNSWSAIEMTAVAFFGSAALISRSTSPWLLVAAFALHPVWALYVHYKGAGSAFAPAPFVFANAAFDVVLAFYLVYLAVQRAPPPQPSSGPPKKSQKGSPR